MLNFEVFCLQFSVFKFLWQFFWVRFQETQELKCAKLCCMRLSNWNRSKCNANPLVNDIPDTNDHKEGSIQSQAVNINWRSNVIPPGNFLLCTFGPIGVENYTQDSKLFMRQMGKVERIKWNYINLLAVWPLASYLFFEPKMAIELERMHMLSCYHSA